MTTILPPDQDNFEVFITVQSVCRGTVVKSCQASFSLADLGEAGEEWTLQRKCRALVQAIAGRYRGLGG